jgi:hypothetical protein
MISPTELKERMQGTLPELLGFDIRSVDEHGVQAARLVVWVACPVYLRVQKASQRSN